MYSEITGTQILRKTLFLGQEINLKIQKERYCTGSESGTGKWITCLARQQQDGELDSSHALRFVHPDDITEGDDPSLILLDSRKFTQCYKCSTTDYFSCRMTCQGDFCNPSSPIAKQYCEKSETKLYLTYVGDQYKIGVSLNPKRRWLEQGSDLATVVAELPGLEARAVEQIGSQELGLKLQVRGTSKLQNLNKIHLEDARKQLLGYRSKIKPFVTKMLQKVDGSYISDDIHELTPIYGWFDQKTPINIVDPIGDIEFGGKILAIKGSIIVVQQGDYQYALDCKAIISRSFSFLDRKAIMPTQSFLDQWF
jgi:hypothetical protein